MAGRRLIPSTIWTDLRSLFGSDVGEDAALLRLYFSTGPHSNMVGLYLQPISYTCEDLQRSPERVKAALSLLEQRGWVSFDPEARVIWVPSILAAQPLQNENQVVSALRGVAGLPHTRLLRELYRELTSQLSGRPYLKPLVEHLEKRVETGFGQGSKGTGTQTPSPAPLPTPAPEPDPTPSPGALPEPSIAPSPGQLAENRHRLAVMAAEIAKQKTISS
jgi:hypothetical protein